MDALETAAAIRRGELSPEEVHASAVGRIEELNPASNAVVIPLFDHDVSAPTVPSAPFAGVPMLMKDLGACLAGLPLYQGNRLLQRMDWRALEDAPIARAFVKAGLRIVGKTNTPEFGAGAATQPMSFGPTRNPWNLEYSTSGSSGGAAAAVAAGLVPIAHGSDFGGSIRMPAAWCGVIGLKPSRGRIDTHPSPPGANTEFVLTRSLRDAAAMLDAVADPHDASGARPEGGWLPSLDVPPRRCRLGLITSVDGVATDVDAVTPAREAAHALASAGHDVVELDGTFLGSSDWTPMLLIIRAKGARARLDALAQIAGRPVGADDTEPLMLALSDLAPTFSDRQQEQAGEWQTRYADALADKWEANRLDAVITPTTGITPRRLDEMTAPPEDPLRIYETFRRVGCFTAAWNMSGHAAISIPWWVPEVDALPRGVQLVTPPGDEDLLLRLAHQLTELAPEVTKVRIAPNR